MVKYFVLGMIFLLVAEPILDTIVDTIQTAFEAIKAKINVYILNKNVEISKLNAETQGFEEPQETQAIGFVLPEEDYYYDDEDENKK
jgi:hypothetical protein